MQPRRRLWAGEAAAKLAEECGWGIGVVGAGVDGGVRGTVVVGGSMQVGDLLLGDHEGEMW
jgi:hypothetical protein